MSKTWSFTHTDLHRVSVQVSLGQLIVKLGLQLPSIQIGLGKLIVKLGLLIGVVIGKLVKSSLYCERSAEFTQDDPR